MSAKDQIKQIVDFFKKEPQLKDKTDGMAEGLMLGASLADEANERSLETDDAFKRLQREYTENGNGAQTSAEMSVARDGELVLNDRLKRDFGNVNAQLAQIENEKASINYVDAILMDIAKGGPKGLFNSIAALKSAYPTGADGTWLVFDSSFSDGAHSFIWDTFNSQWKDLGVYQATGIADGSVSLKHTNFSPVSGRKSVNLFDKASVIQNSIIDPASGNRFTGHDNYVSTDYIPVDSNADYTFSHIYLTAFYKEDKSYISGISAAKNEIRTVKTPTNAKYLRTTVKKEYLDVYQLEKGTTSSDYETFGYVNKDNSVEKRMIKPKSVTEEEIGFSLFKPSKVSRNLVDLHAITKNKYVSYVDGLLHDSTSYNSSDFTEVLPNTNYSTNYGNQTAFYDKFFRFISGVEPKTINIPFTFKTPQHAKYMKTTIHNNQLSDYQIEMGDTLHEHEPYGWWIEESQLSDSLRNKLSKMEIDKFIQNELEDPSKPVQIKILGDSSTSGSGGSGYSATGEPIGNTGYFANEAGYGWVNQFKKYLETKYGGTKEYGVDRFTIENEVKESDSFGFSWNTKSRVIRRLYGKNVKVVIPFYGDKFKMYYTSHNSVFNMNVEIDGLTQRVNSFDSTGAYTNRKIYERTGLGEGEHVAVITPDTNVNVPDEYKGNIIIESIEFTKHVLVKNWAVAGRETDWMWNNRETLVEDSDTIIWNQMGANDRSRMSIEAYKGYQRQFIKYVKARGKEAILSSVQAGTLENEYMEGRLFHCIDIDIADKEMAKTMGAYYLSNYDAFVHYIQMNRSVKVAELLADDQHPNDLGHTILFEHVMKQLGLPALLIEDSSLG